jgi:hypothetical protein
MLMDVSTAVERDSRQETEERLVRPGAPTTAELAECTCPDFCERDHDTD